MVGWVASLVVIADGATSTHCFVNFLLCVCLTCAFYVPYVCVFFLCVYTCPMGVYMNDLDLVNWCEVITICMTLY